MRYATAQINHFEACSSFRVVAPAGEPPKETEHEGWEYLLAPKGRQQIRIRSQTRAAAGSNVLFYNGLERHKELYPTDRASVCEALVIHSSFVNSLLEPYGVNANEVIFDRIEFDQDPLLASILLELLSFRGIPASSLTFDSKLT